MTQEVLATARSLSGLIAQLRQHLHEHGPGEKVPVYVHGEPPLQFMVPVEVLYSDMRRLADKLGKEV